jgi:hypothetical protein
VFDVVDVYAIVPGETRIGFCATPMENVTGVAAIPVALDAETVYDVVGLDVPTGMVITNELFVAVVVTPAGRFGEMDHVTVPVPDAVCVTVIV